MVKSSFTYLRVSSHWITLMSLAAMLIAPLVTHAQGRVTLTAVAGNYEMKDMKAIQDELQKDLSLTYPTKVVSEFPMSLQLELGFDFDARGSDITKGLYMNYALTKGRIHYADYSGQVYVDQNVSRFQFGGRLRAQVADNIGFYLKGGVTYSKLDFVSVIELAGAGRQEDIVSLHSWGISAEPGFSWGRDFGRLGMLLNVGFELNFQGKTLLDSNPDAHLLLPNGETAAINWTGARFGASLGYYLSRPGEEDMK